MRQRTPLAHLSVALLAAALTVSCQGPAPVAPVTPAVDAAMGTVQLDLADLRARLGSRGVQAGSGVQDPALAVTKLTLRVVGPGMTAAEATIPWLADSPPATTTEAAPLASFSLNVRAGHNRVFILKALNSQNQVLHQYHSLGRVLAGGAIVVRLSAMHDAAARTLLDLINPSSTDQSVPTGLATEDFTEGLVAYVREVTGYDEASNSYAEFNPHFFRSLVLAERVRTQGKGALLQEPDGTLGNPGNGMAMLEVGNYEPGWPYPLEVELRSPILKTRLEVESTFFMFENVPAGEWDVRVKSGRREAWTRVRVSEMGDDPIVNVDLPAASLPTTSETIYNDGLQGSWSVQAGTKSSAPAPTVVLSSNEVPLLVGNGVYASAVKIVFSSADSYVDFRFTGTSAPDFGLYETLRLMTQTTNEDTPYKVQLMDGNTPLGEALEFTAYQDFYGSRSLAISPWYRPAGYRIAVADYPYFQVSPRDLPRVKGFRIWPAETVTSPTTLFLGTAELTPLWIN